VSLPLCLHVCVQAHGVCAAAPLPANQDEESGDSTLVSTCNHAHLVRQGASSTATAAAAAYILRAGEDGGHPSQAGSSSGGGAAGTASRAGAAVVGSGRGAWCTICLLPSPATAAPKRPVTHARPCVTSHPPLALQASRQQPSAKKAKRASHSSPHNPSSSAWKLDGRVDGAAAGGAGAEGAQAAAHEGGRPMQGAAARSSAAHAWTAGSVQAIRM